MEQEAFMTRIAIGKLNCFRHSSFVWPRISCILAGLPVALTLTISASAQESPVTGLSNTVMTGRESALARRGWEPRQPISITLDVTRTPDRTNTWVITSGPNLVFSAPSGISGIDGITARVALKDDIEKVNGELQAKIDSLSGTIKKLIDINDALTERVNKFEAAKP
jgi:hypothetical protein